MKYSKSEENSVGIKIRRRQNDQPSEVLTNGCHESESPMDHDGSLKSDYRKETADMLSVSDNVVKRSHSLEVQNESNSRFSEKVIMQVEKKNNHESMSATVISQSTTAASSPKRHHPSSPVSKYGMDEVATDSTNNQRRSKDSTVSITYSPPFTSLQNGDPEKPMDNDCSMSTGSPLGDDSSSSGNGKPSSPSMRQADPNVSTTNSVASSTKVSVPGVSSNRNGSLLSRPGVSSSNPPSSSRSKTASRSKKHSSRTNLYIRGLPKSMSENDLVSLVPDASAIRSVKLVVNNDGEGYGFIDFVSNEAALVAMQHIKLQNSNQYVNFAYASFFAFIMPIESEKDPLNVYVTNIPESWSSDNVETLKQIFAPYGKITSALVMTRRSTNTCTGTGFVRYLTSEEAQRAIDGIRKAKITLPGAKRPLELKLADRQRAREHKSESIGSENNTLPLFQQFMREDAQQQLTQAIKNQQHHKQMVDDIFNATPISDRSMFDQAKMANYVNSGASLMSPSPVDITPKSSDEISATAPSQLTAPAVMPVSPAVAAATALASPLYQFHCFPWIQQDHTTAPHANPQAAAAYLHSQLAAAAQKANPAATATPLDLHSLAAVYQMAGLGVLNYGATAPAQSFDMILPLLNGQLNGHPIDACRSNWNKMHFASSLPPSLRNARPSASLVFFSTITLACRFLSSKAAPPFLPEYHWFFMQR
ncbi:unnamed protein product [Rodentolepis nana]|uniref:RRM domain-containing protein n=1 Tax=Rodentolepis nana TaxID=102285 RepID=A0A158QHH3_RODNA|nr:unnamed protein product [Rodentolepis nana]